MTSLSLSTKLVGTLGGGSFNLTYATSGNVTDPTATWYGAHVVLNASLTPIDPMTEETGQAIETIAQSMLQQLEKPVAPANPAAPVTDQVVIAKTGTAVPFHKNALVNGAVVKAKTTNAIQNGSYSGMVGPAGVTTLYDGTGNGYPLAPGEAASFAVADASSIYVNGTVGDVFSLEGN